MHLKSASSVRDPAARAPPFGSRLLTDDADVWSQNAWDHVPPPDDQDHLVAASLARQRAAPVPDHDQQKYNATPARHWDNFYKMNAANFFKNRKWLHLEFPELVAAAQPSAGPQTVVEIGCGAGNSIFPLLAQNTNPHLSIHAYDYSSHAVKLVQNNPLYTAPPCGSIHAAVWDLASSPAADGDDSALPPGLAPASADLLVLVFVLSALHPHDWPRALANIHKILKPGGRVLFRDYGRHDLTQLRFRAGRLLADNFYIRGDKTRVYFFELDELALLFTGARAPAQAVPVRTTTTEHVVEDHNADADEGEGEGEGEGEAASASHTPDSDPSGSGTPAPRSPSPSLAPSSSTTPAIPDPAPTIHPSLLPAAPEPHSAAPQPPLHLPHCPPHPLFAAAQLGVDRRLLLNRKRQLKMYRVWMQAQFVKL